VVGILKDKYRGIGGFGSITEWEYFNIGASNGNSKNRVRVEN
jgi:hypothetical protein